MSTIAEKLCGDIVNPVLEQSSASSHYTDISKSQDASPTRSILIEKRKVVNNIIPKGKSAVVITKFRSRETVYNKVFTDKSINTIISGPLTSNIECMTNIRKRATCTCGRVMKPLRNDVKNVQTSKIQLCQADKSCYYCSGTESCITRCTQFSDVSETVKDNNSLRSYQISENPGTSRNRTCRPVYIDSQSARHWALTKYPKRGPDF
ncbi:hypothetical protein RR48_07334 [Papilio machaon]|uniref:Uncharacterized protein n=1 Tax=Papilio machaon TaxID=76193 RepID=A0A194RK64_PAPMA|nr:hypothetical protein RR48_07334 [Papilio machaon]